MEEQRMGDEVMRWARARGPRDRGKGKEVAEEAEGMDLPSMMGMGEPRERPRGPTAPAASQVVIQELEPVGSPMLWVNLRRRAEIFLRGAESLEVMTPTRFNKVVLRGGTVQRGHRVEALASRYGRYMHEIGLQKLMDCRIRLRVPGAIQWAQDPRIQSSPDFYCFKLVQGYSKSEGVPGEMKFPLGDKRVNVAAIKDASLLQMLMHCKVTGARHCVYWEYSHRRDKHLLCIFLADEEAWALMHRLILVALRDPSVEAGRQEADLAAIAQRLRERVYPVLKAYGSGSPKAADSFKLYRSDMPLVLLTNTQIYQLIRCLIR